MMKIIYTVLAWYFRSIARILIALHKPRIVGITGSVGKTTTKDVMTALVGGCTRVRGSIRSQNSELTTPLSILGLEVQNKERRVWVWLLLMLRALLELFNTRFPQVLILELGAGAPGDIYAQVTWLDIHVAVFTALSANPVHVEFFANKQELYDEKKLLATYTHDDGVIVYPAADSILQSLLEPFRDRSVTISSFKQGVRMLAYTPEGTQAEVLYRDRWIPIVVPGVWSESIIDSYRLSLEVVHTLGLSADQAVARFGSRYTPPPGRARVLQGIRGSVVIDDSYNASPIAVTGALYTFESIEAPRRKIFVFGDMKELGEYSLEAHRDVGRQAAGFVDILVTIGDDSQETEKIALESGMSREQVEHFASSQEAGVWLKHHLQHRDYVLAKASRHSIKMEQALEQIVREDQRQYLVQEYLQN